MRNRDLYLIQDELGVPERLEGEIISLTPEASYGLGRRGIPYKILEDYPYQAAVASFEDSFFIQQKDWVCHFDAYLQSNVAACRENDLFLAGAHFWRLKYFIDSIVESAIAFRTVLEATKPNCIFYYAAPHDSRKFSSRSIAFIYDNTKRFYFSIVTELCKEMSIPLERRPANKEISIAAGDWQKNKKSIGFFEKGQREISRYLKSAYHFAKNHKYERFFAGDKAYRNVSVFVLDAGPKDVEPIARGLIRRGSKVFLKTENKIWNVSKIIHSEIFDLVEGAAPYFERVVETFQRPAENFMNSMLMEWLNEMSGIDARSFASPYFIYFIAQRCPQVVSEISATMDFFKKYPVDFVMARNSASFANISGLLAAKISGIKRVCFQHGCTALDRPVEHFTETELFDLYFATDPESREHHQGSVKKYAGRNCEILEYADFLKFSRPKPKTRKREIVYYVPTRSQVGIRMLNCHYPYPANWHYHFEIAVLDFLAAYSDKDIVLKYVISPDWFEKSTLAYVRQKNYANVRLRSDNLSQCMGEADRIIIDYPGTALYETVAAGIPTLCLYDARMRIKALSQRVFGKCLQPFQSVEDALSKIHDFLKDFPQHYVQRIDLTREDAVDTLVHLKSTNKTEEFNCV